MSYPLYFEGGESPKAPPIHTSVGTPSMRQLTRCGEDQTGSLCAWNMENEHTREILPTSFIIAQYLTYGMQGPKPGITTKGGPWPT
jgi:hypothetical protein